MTLLITGGAGFVLSNLARHWLETKPDSQVVIFDAMEWDSAAENFLGSYRRNRRLFFVNGDVLEAEIWSRISAEHDITHVVHGATITPSPEREKADPRQILEVNIMGTVQALEWARGLRSLQRFIYTSSSAVYGEALPGTPDVPIPEDGYVMPVDIYGITKFACELIAKRYGELYGLPVVSVRFSGVYGPMDRATPARTAQCIPNRIAHLALAGGTIKTNALDAGGDWIHAADIARALAALLEAPHPRHDVYNAAYGEFKTIGEMIEIVREAVPGTKHEVAPITEANVAHDPRRRLGRWSDYDISRLREEFGWRPHPLREALQSYVQWIKENE